MRLDQLRVRNYSRMKNAVIPALVSFISASCVQAPHYYSAFYHDTIRSPYLVLFGGILNAVLLSIPVIAVTAVSSNRALAHALTTLILLFTTYRIILIPIAGVLDFSIAIKSILGSVFIAIGGFVYLERDQERVVRFLKLGLVCIVGWVAATPIVGLIRSSVHVGYIEVFDFGKIVDRVPAATVFVVLDEWSPEMMGPVEQVLESDEMILYSGVTEKAGTDTIYAIPSMLTKEAHKDVIPCGPYALCGRTFFSPKNLRASNPVVDVVGFYHPYCEISGLRTCKRVTSRSAAESTELSLKSILGVALTQIPIVGKYFSALTEDIWNELKYDLIVDDILRSALVMPIWDRGGVLYVHQLLPHPKMIKGRSLATEYRENLNRAAEFIGALDIKLREKFDDDYLLIITSDHPLRTLSKWCVGVYASDDCALENPPEGGQVPILVKASRSTQIGLPKTNIGVLAK